MRSLFAAVAIAFLFLTACHSATHDDVIELRTYDVPKGTAGELVNTIKDVLWMNENKNVGRVAVTPDGRLAVLATPPVQSGVQQLIDEVTKHPPKADPTVTLHYFLVLGKPGAAPYPNGVGEIKPALDEIVKSQGPQTFSLAGRATLSSLHDEEARLDNSDLKLEIRQFAVQTTDGVYAKLSIRLNEDKVETRVQLSGDRIVVLGTTGHTGDADGATLYYVVRVAP